MPEIVVIRAAERYVRDILPSFSANPNFGYGTRTANVLSRELGRVRLGTRYDKDIAATGLNIVPVVHVRHGCAIRPASSSDN